MSLPVQSRVQRLCPFENGGRATAWAFHGAGCALLSLLCVLELLVTFAS